MRNVMISRARERNTRGDCPLIGRHEIELRLELEGDVIEAGAVALTKRTRVPTRPMSWWALPGTALTNGLR
jgi:hypothetical protein